MLVTTFEYLPSETVALSSLPSSMSLAICSPSHLNVNTAVIAPKIKETQNFYVNMNPLGFEFMYTKSYENAYSTNYIMYTQSAHRLFSCYFFQILFVFIA